jgi:membrane-associated protease RseP (regulator of RpoE activity)
MCAVHGWFFHITMGRHWLGFGYYWKPNWFCVFPPLVITVALAARRRYNCARFVASAAVTVALTPPSAFSASNPEKVLQRGWIGGDYKTARKDTFKNAMVQSQSTALCLRKELSGANGSAVLVCAVATNSPAGLAGLQSNDFILAVNGQHVRNLRQFRRLIDAFNAADVARLTVYRHGATLELPIQVGTETYKPGGSFSVVFPSVVHRWDLFFHPGFSLVFFGYEPNPGLRPQLENEKQKYQEDWNVFAAIFELSSGKRILSQRAQLHVRV